jgi:hypothetical protein
MKENNSNSKNPIKKVPGKKIVPKPPKFNIMWLYAVIILGLFVVQYLFSSTNTKTISYQKFETEMLKTGDVEKLVTYKNGGLDTVLAEIGLENLVLETDAPYLSPAPHRGKRNSPLYLPLIAQRVADLTENDISIVSELTQSNVQKIFNNFEA